MRHAGRSARRLATALVPVLAGVLLPGCDSSGSAPNPPFVGAVVVGFPSGGAPPGFAGGVVQVLDSATGEPVTNAVVTLNGLALPWDPVNQDYEGAFATQAAAAVQLAVSVAGETYRATATFFSEGPSILLANPAPSGCENRLAWSGGAPAGTGPTLVAVLDAAAPHDPVYGPMTTGAGAGEIALASGTLPPGDRLVLVGVSSEVPVPGAHEGSGLVLVGARTAPLSVVDADYRELTLSPANRGIGTGEALPLHAAGAICGGFEWRDVTETATWSSSDAAVADVSNVVGSAGVATGAGKGTAVITADVKGIRGSTIVGVRDFTRRDSTVPGEGLDGVSWTGTTLVAVGTSGTVLSSPDGVTWTRRPTGSPAQLTGVAASPDLVAAVMYGSSTVLTSQDLVSWTPRDAGAAASAGLWSIRWTGAEFVAVGIGGAIVTSADGATWVGRASGTPYTLTGIAIGGSRLVAVGGYGGLVGQVVTSQDGVTWTSRDLPSELGYLRAVAYGGTQFVGMGDYGPLASPDGFTWTRRNGPAGMEAIAASPGELMAVGGSGEIATTTDGATWITWKAGDFALRDVTWTGTQWVIVGGSGTIYTAP